MATFTKRESKRGTRWRALVRMKGRVQCATFPTRQQAVEWANRAESEALGGHYGLPSKKTLGEAIRKFAAEVSPGRKGARWEQTRLAAFQEREKRLCARPLASLNESDLAEFRDRRLEIVSTGTVRREMALLGGVLEVARKEWKWISRNPLREVRKPVAPAARRRGIGADEVSAIVKSLGQTGAGLQIAQAFLLALETAMRAGEILGLTWDHVDLQNRTVLLPKTKNGDSRQVPLSTAAIAILGELVPVDDGANAAGIVSKVRVFAIAGPTLDVLFRRARDAAAKDLPSCATVRFHDSRSEAITRLSRKLDVLELARVVGHRQLSSLLHYYSASAAEIARKLG